jgi:hypothetical protein
MYPLDEGVTFEPNPVIYDRSGERTPAARKVA